jgi:hypothetical protein
VIFDEYDPESRFWGDRDARRGLDHGHGSTVSPQIRWPLQEVLSFATFP